MFERGGNQVETRNFPPQKTLEGNPPSIKGFPVSTFHSGPLTGGLFVGPAGLPGVGGFTDRDTWGMCERLIGHGYVPLPIPYRTKAPMFRWREKVDLGRI